jgi:hypothetical protein
MSRYIMCSLPDFPVLSIRKSCGQLTSHHLHLMAISTATAHVAPTTRQLSTIYLWKVLAINYIWRKRLGVVRLHKVSRSIRRSLCCNTQGAGLDNSYSTLRQSWLKRSTNGLDLHLMIPEDLGNWGTWWTCWCDKAKRNNLESEKQYMFVCV